MNEMAVPEQDAKAVEGLAGDIKALIGKMITTLGGDIEDASSLLLSIGDLYLHHGNEVRQDVVCRMLSQQLALNRARAEGTKDEIARLEEEMGIGPMNRSEWDDDHDDYDLGVRIETDTPEEDFVLQNLLLNRIRPGDDFRTVSHYYTGPEAEPPKCESVVKALYSKFHSISSWNEGINLLLAHTDAFVEMQELYTQVAAKYGLETVQSKQDWLQGRSVEEVAATKEGPVDLSSALSSYGFDFHVERYIWELKKAGAEEELRKLRFFLEKVPDPLFIGARGIIRELEDIDADLQDFETWLLDRAETGVFRTEVMAEIERRWKERPSARRFGKMWLERLEHTGRIVRAKKQGKLRFTRTP